MSQPLKREFSSRLPKGAESFLPEPGGASYKINRKRGIL